MQMKWFARSACSDLSKLAFATLLMFSATVSSQERDEIVYDMVVEVNNYTDFDRAGVVDRVEVHFNNPPFYWDIGGIPEGDRVRLSDPNPRKPPQSLLLSWEANGEPYHVPFTIKMPPPKLMESIRDSAVEIDGHVVRNHLELFFEISSDSNTGRIYWRENKVHPMTSPKGDSSIRAANNSK